MKSTIQVYFSSIAGSLHTGAGALAWSTTTFAIMVAVASPLVGSLADRFGGATVLIAGTALAGATFLLCAALPSVLLFAPSYGIVGATSYTMLSYVPLGKLADELFAERGQGLVFALMTNGPAIGFIILVPLWVWLGTLISWRIVFLADGLAMLAVLTPLALLLKRLSAEGEGAAREAATATAPLALSDRLRMVIRNHTFIVLALAFGGCGVTMAFIDVHLVTDLDMAGMRPAVVSGTVSVLGLFEVIGSLIAGRFCDRDKIKQTLVAGYGLRGLAMLLLVFTPTTVTSLVFGIIFGVSYMMTVIATTLWVARVVPAGGRATALGLVWTVHGAGAALSSQLGAYGAQHFRSYTQVSLAEAITVFVSLALVSQLRPPNRPPTGRSDGGLESDESDRSRSDL